MKIDLSGKMVMLIVLMSLVAVIFSSAYKYFILKDYIFEVEASCNPGTENCFHRDCGPTDECPPNGLEDYRVFEIKASDYKICTDQSCKNECSTGKIVCNEIICGAGDSDQCSNVSGNEGII